MLNPCPLVDSRSHRLPDGKHMRYALFEPSKPPIGTVLIAPGRREFIEKKHAELGHELLERGYRLIHVEWRGQGLSDRFIGEDNPSIRQRDHVTDFSIHMNDLTSFYEAVVKPGIAGPLILCGHSLGAHLLLRWQMENPAIPTKAMILTGPMLALAGAVVHTSAHAVCWGAIKLGYGRDYAPMQHDYNADDRSFEGNPLSHDKQRFAIMEKYFTAWPKLTVGGVTWEWLDAAIKSMQVTQAGFRLERVKLPVLTITGSEDRVTPYAEISRYIKRLPQVKNILLQGSLHDVMNEAEPLRAAAWGHIDGFLGTIA